MYVADVYLPGLLINLFIYPSKYIYFNFPNELCILVSKL